jgi:hypothetical protein
MEATDIKRSRREGECLRCARPPDLKGHHKVKECKTKIKVDPGTAINLKALRIKSILQDSSNNSRHTGEE